MTYMVDLDKWLSAFEGRQLDALAAIASEVSLVCKRRADEWWAVEDALQEIERYEIQRQAGAIG